MKLALIRQRYTPFGGAERFIERSLAPLVAAGVEVHVLAREWQGETPEGFHWVRIDPPYARWRGRGARDASFAAAVQAHLTGTRYDLVQSHERIPGCHIFRAGDGVHAAWLARRAPLLSGLRRLGEALSPFHRRILAAERAMLTHPALRVVVCNSALVRREFVSHYGVPAETLQVIRNGVDLDAFHPGLRETHRTEARARLGIDAAAHVFVFVGSGFERKGADRAMTALRALPPSAHLVIVGADRHADRSARTATEAGLAGRVHLTGPQRDVRPYYAMADTFVLPTLYDPLPNAALEALACGLPVITSTGCGAAELIESPACGAVVDALDVAALARAMAARLVDPDPAASRRAARAAVAGLSLAAQTAHWTALYRQLAPAAAGAAAGVAPV